MKAKAKRDAKKVYKFLTENNVRDMLVFGNGGSAAIANHMEVDWSKNSEFTWDVRSLCSNSSMLTMLANDFGYACTCSEQLSNKANNSTLILISSSGNSENIVQAARVARRYGMLVIGFTGFDGGELKKLSDVSVHINSKDYEEAEDYHHMVMHDVSRILRDLK